MRTRVAQVLCCLLLICALAGPGQACTCFCMDTPDGPVFGSNLDLFFPADGLVVVEPGPVGPALRRCAWAQRKL